MSGALMWLTIPGMDSKHLKHHEREYICPHCEQACPEPKDLRRHIAAMHRDLNPEAPWFPCPVDGCSKGSAREDNLKRHVRTQHNK